MRRFLALPVAVWLQTDFIYAATGDPCTYFNDCDPDEACNPSSATCVDSIRGRGHLCFDDFQCVGDNCAIDFNGSSREKICSCQPHYDSMTFQCAYSRTGAKDELCLYTSDCVGGDCIKTVAGQVCLCNTVTARCERAPDLECVDGNDCASGEICDVFAKCVVPTTITTTTNAPLSKTSSMSETGSSEVLMSDNMASTEGAVAATTMSSSASAGEMPSATTTFTTTMTPVPVEDPKEKEKKEKTNDEKAAKEAKKKNEPKRRAIRG